MALAPQDVLDKWGSIKKVKPPNLGIAPSTCNPPYGLCGTVTSGAKYLQGPLGVMMPSSSLRQ